MSLTAIVLITITAIKPKTISDAARSIGAKEPITGAQAVNKRVRYICGVAEARASGKLNIVF